jgi:hypothetical protein
MLQAGRSPVLFQMRSFGHAMALRFTQPVTEMSTRNLPGVGGGVKARPSF